MKRRLLSPRATALGLSAGLALLAIAAGPPALGPSGPSRASAPSSEGPSAATTTKDGPAAPAKAPASASATPAVAGLRARVTVRRDARGIPHIEAANEHDLFLAQGFVTASDRLWQMDLLRRTARGELAEILGRDVLDQDEQMRVLGLGRFADGLVERLPTRVREPLAAYAEGVNAYITALGDRRLPPEFGILDYEPRPWRPSDSLVICKLFALDLTLSWPRDMMRASFANLPADRRAALFVETSPLDVVLVGEDTPGGSSTPAGAGEVKPHPSLPKKPAALSGGDSATGLSASGTPALPLPPGALVAARASQQSARSALARVGLWAEGLAASNNWVVSGARSMTGKPLLANDPHLSPSTPSIWHLAHLSAPGLHVAGATAPGVAGILIGHNERIAWGVTNLMADVQDLYAETFESARAYATPAGSRDADVRTERILVRSETKDGQPEVVEREVTVTRHGPVVFEAGNQRYALRWTALDPDACEVESFLAVDRASGWKEFTAALERLPGPPLNFVYADTSGHIGYYAAGRIPLRTSGDGSLPYDGTTNAGEWSGYVPFGELPHLYDPPSGAIVTANNRVVGRNYPHVITRGWVVPYRARRISELLAAKPRLSAGDFETIQADAHSYADAIFARAVVDAAKAEMARGERARPEWAAMVKAFDGWDGRTSASSRAVPLAVGMRRVFARKVLEAALGAERANGYHWPNRDTFIDGIVTTRPAGWLPKEYASWADLWLACWAEAREALAGEAGSDPDLWTWGRVGPPVTFPHALSERPAAGARFAIEPLPASTEGSSDTVNAGKSVSMRFVADTSDWDRSRQGIALGQSGDPSSPHWKDQLADWRAVTTPAFPFTRAAVARAAVETQVLTPASPAQDGARDRR